jgi:hypothetical protein
MKAINLEVWLYGPLARFAGEASGCSHARLLLQLPAGSTMGDLLRQLGIPLEERGITFVNGRLAALPGVEADLDMPLNDGDRVGISHSKSMWPFQYRSGVQMTPHLENALRQREDGNIHHSYATTRKPK